MFLELVQEKHGQYGRYIIAKEDISRGSYGIEKKVRVSLTPSEVHDLSKSYDNFVLEFLSTMSSSPIHIEFSNPEHLPYSRAMLFIGKCIEDNWIGNSIIMDLMACTLSDNYLTETIERMMLHDMLFFEYWKTTYDMHNPDDIWKLMSFVLSHALLENDTLTIGEYMSRANCPQKRWNTYLESQDGHKDLYTSEILGNFMDVPEYCIDIEHTHEKIQMHDCVLFLKDIKKGEEIVMDYGPHYLLSKASQLRNYEGSALQPILVHIVSSLDIRVLLALAQHMSLGNKPEYCSSMSYSSNEGQLAQAHQEIENLQLHNNKLICDVKKKEEQILLLQQDLIKYAKNS